MQGSFLQVYTNWHAKFGAVLAMFDFREKSSGHSCMWPSFQLKNITLYFFFAGLLFVFEILRMQKLVFVVAPARDCKDGNFT